MYIYIYVYIHIDCATKATGQPDLWILELSMTKLCRKSSTWRGFFVHFGVFPCHLRLPLDEHATLFRWNDSSKFFVIEVIHHAKSFIVYMKHLKNPQILSIEFPNYQTRKNCGFHLTFWMAFWFVLAFIEINSPILKPPQNHFKDPSTYGMHLGKIG